MPATAPPPEYNIRTDWLALHNEPVIEPGRPIIDAHHHMGDKPGIRYLFPDLLADMRSGHNVLASVFIEWRSMYRRTGPVEMRPAGSAE